MHLSIPSLSFVVFSLLCQPSFAQETQLPCGASEPGCSQKFFSHYLSLKTVLERVETEHPEWTKELGKELESAYQSTWLQRFEKGIIVHLSQHVPFTQPTLPSHEGTSFVIQFDQKSKEKGRFFYQWSPRVTGIYDVDLFQSILSSYPRNPDLFGWPQGPRISDSKLREMFRPYAELSPQNLCGGISVVYAMYRLDQYLGRPLEQQFTRTLLRKNYEKGYVLLGMPNPNSKEPATASNLLYRDDVQFTYLFKTEKEPEGSTDTNKYASGKKFRLGSWSALFTDLGPDEKKTRPLRGLFRK